MVSHSYPAEASEGTSAPVPEDVGAAPGSAFPIISQPAKHVSPFFWQDDAVVIPWLVLNDCVHVWLNKAEGPI